ncbi:MAG: hypothetical protein KBC38_01295 [Candidatus Pacebacteria bacterium]|nr:hypothetical protein [Candidatus Paceibacterota bacterium]MBP9840270.1 hypothetical protein [Candidatus Paceibacterota bacterium]
MVSTVFLASLWGPAILAIGLGMMLNKAYYVKIYRGIQNEMLAVLILGLGGIAAALAQIQAHNVWGTLPEILVSFLGWGLLVKGIAMAVFPKFADKGGDFAANTKIVPSVAIILILLGVYLSWFAYLG